VELVQIIREQKGFLHMAQKKTTKRRKTATTAEVKPRTKTQIYGEISDDTGLTRKEVACVFDAMTGMVKKDLGRRGPGTFTVPGLMKIRKHRKPATKRRFGKNPFTGEEQWFKAKAAKNVVKFTALKNLKEMV
jgi:nucleoid DNA-binding protein